MKIDFKMPQKNNPLVVSLISGILLILFGITGCSDVPYTGPMLTVGHVDQYLNTIDQDTVCLQDGFDTVCVKLLLDKTEIDPTNIDYTPTVHVHPTSMVYVFDYQGRTLLEAKRLMDTTQIVQELVTTGRAQLPSGVGNLEAENRLPVAEGWIIQVYYPDTFPEARRGQTLATSGLDIRVGQGTAIPRDRQRDLKITNFAQIDNQYGGKRGVKFSVQTQVPRITIQVQGIVPGNTATFYINADSVESNDSTNVLKLHPLP